MDEIIIKKLKVYCNHGVMKKEQIIGQNFYVTAKILCETYNAAKSDNLEDTINYADVCGAITDFMKNTRFNLIEALAENLAELILNYSPLVKGVELTIDKPEAPVNAEFENISVKIKRRWRQAYISFGSNLGDKMKYIQDAFDKINNNPAIRILKTSSIKTTKPYGHVEQDDFLNGVMLVETFMRPEELLRYLNELEALAGRVRDTKWGPRTLDLDIVLFEQEVIYSEKLVIPHIDMQNRPFVLEPLCEIAPYAYHPVFCKTVRQLLNEYRDR